MQKINIDSQSKFEAEAYKESLQGALDIEYERYTEALNHLIKAKLVYQAISK